MNRTITSLLFFLFVNYGFTQVGSDYMFKNDLEKSALKGNIKSIKTVLKDISEEREDSNLFFKYNPVLHNYDAKDEYDQELYLKEFNTYGIMTAYCSERKLDLNNTFDKNSIFKFVIDSTDFVIKQQMKKQYGFPFAMNINRTYSYDDTKTIYTYEYKIENQKITEELYFEEYISPESPKEEHPKFNRRILFFYNANGRLVKKQIIIPGDEYNYQNTETYYDQQINKGNTLDVTYLYNDAGQLVKMTVYKKKVFLYQETYKIKNNKVVEMEKLVESKQTHNDFDSNKVVYQYDDFGNVTAMTCYDNDVGEEILSSILFDYTFDDRGNWTICKMYVNQKNKVPDAVAERKIEYFKN